MKVLVTYFSKSGNTAAMAKILAAALKDAGAEAVVMPADETSNDDLLAADAVAFGSPDYFSYVAGRVKVIFDDVLKHFKAIPDKLCTTCGYYSPCPQGVDIPAVSKLANASRIYGLVEGSRRDYALFDVDWPYDKYKNAASCTECGACLEKCPQKIDIPTELKKAHKLLT